MKKISIIAGSKSDYGLIEPMIRMFKTNGVPHEYVILSAHRDKRELGEYLELCDADIIVGAAGLSAALPGSIAADVEKPVFGLPLDSGSESSAAGLESILSIAKMPPPKEGKSVPVGTFAINGAEYAAKFLCNIAKMEQQESEYDVCIMHNVIFEEQAKKLATNLEKLGLRHNTINSLYVAGDIAQLYILISDSMHERKNVSDNIYSNRKPIICVPIQKKEDVNVLKSVRECCGYADADKVIGRLMDLYNLAPKAPAVSVGYNRMDNAAYLARRILRTEK